MKLTSDEKRKVINCCKENLISDYNFDPTQEYESQWFVRKFDFLNNKKLGEHLGDEFYQARVTYTLMQTLSLTMAKNKGIVKFQIIQYASICEALLNYTLECYHKDEFEKKYAAQTYTDVPSALSSKTQIIYDGKPLYLCRQKVDKAKITWTSNPAKAVFALEKGILTEDTQKQYCELYELRNNAHILKAATADYYPKLKEASAAYELTFRFIAEIKAYFTKHQQNK